MDCPATLEFWNLFMVKWYVNRPTATKNLEKIGGDSMFGIRPEDVFRRICAPRSNFYIKLSNFLPNTVKYM